MVIVSYTAVHRHGHWIVKVLCFTTVTLLNALLCLFCILQTFRMPLSAYNLKTNPSLLQLRHQHHAVFIELCFGIIKTKE